MLLSIKADISFLCDWSLMQLLRVLGYLVHLFLDKNMVLLSWFQIFVISYQRLFERTDSCNYFTIVISFIFVFSISSSIQFSLLVNCLVASFNQCFLLIMTVSPPLFVSSLSFKLPYSMAVHSPFDKLCLSYV